MTSLPETVSTAEFARLVGLTPRRIQQVVSTGELPSAGYGKIKLAEGVKAYVKWRVENEMKGRIADASDLDAERTRKLRLENDETERQLLRMDDAMAALDAIVGQVPADLAAVPARVTDDITIRRKIEDEIDIALNGLSKRFFRAGADMEAGRDALGADAPDDADGMGEEG